MDDATRIGLVKQDTLSLHRHINLKLAELGFAAVPIPGEQDLLDPSLAHFIAHSREKDRLLATYLCPADHRIDAFIHDYLCDVVVPPKLPRRSFTLDRYGLARMLSLPPERDEAVSPTLKSYRLKNGILHNPKSDRRTTAGIFHVVEGGLPIPNDKKAVPKEVFAQLLRVALSPPADLLRLPFTALQPSRAECFVTLLLRPCVSPEVPGYSPKKSMETRFFVPGSLVANLDFVESIFGNGGDPYLPENDAGLDVEHWSGHTGCVILAPHLNGLKKKALGLPSWEAASERQRRDGMCWKSEDELYNEGSAFKITVRDPSGIIVTLISDNYFGYCKKEVKTQISYATNLYGLSEEEHAGGALVFARNDLASEYDANQHRRDFPQTFADIKRLLGDSVEVRPEGYAVDKNLPQVIYVPETTAFNIESQAVSWPTGTGKNSIRLRQGEVYVLPSGFRIHLEPPIGNRAWRLIGTRPEGVLCHKPCTVSGGGKSEISKPISDAIIYGPVFVADFEKDFDAVEALLKRSYSDRFRDPTKLGKDQRPVLSPQRTLGSVIKLLTPNSDYSEAYNSWLGSVPQHIKELALVVKRFWKPAWGDQWREKFSVDIVNGVPANELRLGRKQLATQFLRVGYDSSGAWRTFGLRKDYQPAAKIQMEDDITASATVPRSKLAPVNTAAGITSVKFVDNVEYRLFQRPDDAIVRGYDHTAERDFSGTSNFFSNYEPLTREFARELLEDAIGFQQFTEPMRTLIRSIATQTTSSPNYFVSTAHPRIVDGKPSKNPRYLQLRTDISDALGKYLIQVCGRLARQLSPEQPLLTPVDAILAGRRNNPAEPGVRSLACYGPIHYLELPELFMEFISSMTGKSPSTTGAGSEGAMTKGPFNALPPIYDLNASLVSYLVSGYHGFLTSAGCVGPKLRVDHDISLLVPEVWCRMGPEERDPRFLLANGYLEACEDFEHEGKLVPASRLGYRITTRFVHSFFGRVFNHPHSVLTQEMLRPEMQDRAEFIDAVDNIVTTHRRVAENYFDDGSIDLACPPLRALLHIMRDGHYEGKTIKDPAIRALFKAQSIANESWYQERLMARQTIDVRLWQRHAAYLERFLARPSYQEEARRLDVAGRLNLARTMLERVKAPAYLAELVGTIGGEPSVVIR
ncbi:MAG TPA: hypothetical protein VMF06_11075 [Candidatus Limnocylindria bacterium]|nr:hypothetical protein [Candidatus Limnocylindria bacterium]